MVVNNPIYLPRIIVCSRRSKSECQRYVERPWTRTTPAGTSQRRQIQFSHYHCLCNSIRRTKSPCRTTQLRQVASLL